MSPGSIAWLVDHLGRFEPLHRFSLAVDAADVPVVATGPASPDLYYCNGCGKIARIGDVIPLPCAMQWPE